jgi:CFEM domain
MVIFGFFFRLSPVLHPPYLFSPEPSISRMMYLVPLSKNISSAALVFLFVFNCALSSNVDFSKIPQCAIGNCFPYHSSSIGCTQLTTDCFCNALAPINCASKNCTGNQWYAVEDWFATQCPNPPNVTFSGLPECSRACFRSAIDPTYCEGQITRNCFCRLETEFEGMTSCLEESACNETAVDANSTLVDYYRETCVYDPTADGTGGQDESSTSLGDQVVNAPSGSSAVDKLSLIVGLTSGFAALIGIAIGFCVWLHRQVS